MIKVSIVVPVYNVEKYIRKCLDSLVNQTLKDIEIIVVNDGATDGSQIIINEFVCQYPTLVKSVVKENGGLSDARNYGMLYCTGEYIGFIDSDDYVDLTMYEIMYAKAKEENSDIVVCDYYKSYPSKNELVKAKKYVSKKDMFIDTLAAAWNKIYRKSILEISRLKFSKGLIYEDTEFFCKLIPYISVASYVSQPFVYYVQRYGSIANTQDQKTVQMFKVLKNVLDYYKKVNLFTEYREELEYLYIRIMLGSHFERVCQIEDRKARTNLQKFTFRQIELNFPDWKSNYYLNCIQSKRHFYMKMINKYTLHFIGLILHEFFLIKRIQLN
jgi:glycosyltransferase involved in cell wall biosynthesis